MVAGSTQPQTAHIIPKSSATDKSLTRRACHHKSLLQQASKQWTTEHLTSLREQSSTGNKGHSHQEISIGDVVLLKNDLTRCHWKLGEVEELIYGSDGRVCAAVQ